MNFVSTILVSLFLIYAVNAVKERNTGVRRRQLKKSKKDHGQFQRLGGGNNLRNSQERTGTFMMVLSPSQETTPCDSNAMGSGVFSYKNGMLCAHISYTGLENGDVENRSHIHGPSEIGETYAETVLAFFDQTMRDGLPGGNKSRCYDLSEVDDAKGYDEGTVEDWLFDGLLNVNIHTKLCDKGELRGQIILISGDD